MRSENVWVLVRKAKTAKEEKRPWKRWEKRKKEETEKREVRRALEDRTTRWEEDGARKRAVLHAFAAFSLLAAFVLDVVFRLAYLPAFIIPLSHLWPRCCHLKRRMNDTRHAERDLWHTIFLREEREHERVNSRSAWSSKSRDTLVTTT